MKELQEFHSRTVLDTSSLKAWLYMGELKLPKMVNFSSESFDVLGWKDAQKAIDELEQLSNVHGKHLPYLIGIALRETWFACLRNFYIASIHGELGMVGGIEGGQELEDIFAYTDERGWTDTLASNLEKINESMERKLLREETPYEECPSDGDILKSMAVYWFALAADELRAGYAASANDWIHEAHDALLRVNGNEMWDHSAEQLQTKASTRGKKAANVLHDQPGGSREKQDAIRAIWATGIHGDRDLCATEEHEALGMSWSTARKALRNTPKPLSRRTA